MILYDSIQCLFSKPADKRTEIDELTETALIAAFGDHGQFAWAKAHVFNKATSQFMSLQTFTEPLDAINPANWSTVAQYIVEFPVWQAGESYDLGSCVVFTDSFATTNFWIGVAPSTPGQSPETHPANWYNLSAASTLTVQNQKILYRLDTRNPEGLASRQFTINADANVSNNGSRIPNIQVFADLQETVGLQSVLTEIEPNIVQWTESGIVKFQLTFSGDLSSIYFDLGTPSQTNITITLS